VICSSPPREVKLFNDGLFADDVWPGAVVLSDHLCAHPEIISCKRYIVR
jgi:hypothetical protein